MTSSPDTRNRWALLIGINEYPFLGLQSYLKGCVNDVEVMSRTLVERFGFPQENLTVLRDSHARQAHIRAAMNALAERVGKDDVVVFHFSGHGSRMRDREGDEADGYDETIVPYDSGRSTENRDITDDEIYEWLLRLTARTSNITLIFDCCHSGTIVRDVFGEKSRWVPDDTRPLDQLPPSPISSETRSRLTAATREVGASGWLPLGEKYILFAGCSNAESSYEVKVGEGEGVRHGALTYFLNRELSRAESGTTCLDVFEKVAPRVTALYPRQHPQLEGARNHAIFGVETIEPMTFVPVVGREGKQVTLWAGAAAGMTAGSVWAVHPSGTKKAEGAELLGEVAITKVEPVTSVAEVTEGQADAIQAGARAVELQHALGKTRWVVEVVAPEDAARPLRSLIQGSRLLRLAQGGETADARVYLLSPRKSAGPGDPAPMLEELTEETWAAVDGDGQLLMLPRRRYDPDSIPALVRNLEGRIRIQHTADLENPHSSLAGLVDLKVLRRLPDGSWGEPEKEEGAEPVLYDGDDFILEITNRSGRPLFMYVLNLGSGGAVDQIYPVQGAHEAQAFLADPSADPLLAPAVEAGRTIRVGVRHGEEMQVGFPEVLAENWRLLGRQTLEGRETFKLFATTRPADFRVLLQPGYLRGKSGDSLTDLLVAFTGGNGYREVSRRSPEDDWVTVGRSFRLLPRSEEGLASVAAG